MTVKCRIGVDDMDSYDYLCNFVDYVSSGISGESGERSNVDHEGRDGGAQPTVDSCKIGPTDTKGMLGKEQAYDTAMKELEYSQKRERRLSKQLSNEKVVDHFVVHARKALLLGRYSTIDNRRLVYLHCQVFPQLAHQPFAGFLP